MIPLPRPAWRGRVAYRRALLEQRARREAIIAGEQEAFWLLEHDEVYTCGRRAVGLLPDAALLRRRGADLVHTERGGLATWHGPGQLVGYTLLNLGARCVGVRVLVDALEQGLIDWLAGIGISASRRAGLHGVWVGEAKVAAIGLHVRHGVTLHGFALNLSPDLAAFDAIVPCGVVGGNVTSVARLLGRAPNVALASVSVGEAVLRALRLVVDTEGQGDISAGVATRSHTGT